MHDVRWVGDEEQELRGAHIYVRLRWTHLHAAQGSLRSEYIVAAFATHLNNIKGSVQQTNNYPTGTLALSCATVSTDTFFSANLNWMHLIIELEYTHWTYRIQSFKPESL